MQPPSLLYFISGLTDTNKMRVYIFLGLFILLLVPISAIEEGFASWYGGKFQGRQTASGEIFDTEKLTAAHKSLPFGTLVKVTNVLNEKSTVVRINDRGPFVNDRIIDLSRAAAEEIDMLAAGIARVKVEILGIATPEPEKITYTIQAGSFLLAENAYKMREQLEAKNFKVTFEKTTANLIRVLIIEIAPQELDAAKTILKALNFTGSIVKKVKID